MREEPGSNSPGSFHTSEFPKSPLSEARRIALVAGSMQGEGVRSGRTWAVRTGAKRQKRAEKRAGLFGEEAAAHF